jgi:hypothetical protein
VGRTFCEHWRYPQLPQHRPRGDPMGRPSYVIARSPPLADDVAISRVYVAS